MQYEVQLIRDMEAQFKTLMVISVMKNKNVLFNHIDLEGWSECINSDFFRICAEKQSVEFVAC